MSDLDTVKHMRVVVIGAGIVGMFSSYYLARNGFAVTMIDRDSVGGETSVNNAGLIVPSFAVAPTIGLRKVLLSYIGKQNAVYASPLEVLRNAEWLHALENAPRAEEALIEFGKRSLHLYNEFLAENAIDIDLVKGVAGLYKDEDLARRTAKQLNGRFISASEAHAMGFMELGGGVVFDEELSVNPLKLRSALREKLARLDVRMIFGRRVELHEVQSGIVSFASGGENLRGDMYVLAAGARSREICKTLGYDPRILPSRGLKIAFDTGGNELIKTPTLLEDYGVAVVQNNENSAFATAFFELRGFQRQFSESRKSWLTNVLRKHVRNYHKMKYLSEGVGYRPCTSDQLPIIGRIPGYANLMIASGHCRLGVTLAPATGDMVASFLKEPIQQDPLSKIFDPSRFKASYKLRKNVAA